MENGGTSTKFGDGAIVTYNRDGYQTLGLGADDLGRPAIGC